MRPCMGICGGIHDRLGQLPWDLYLANQTRRILLIHWIRPVSLHYFLVPNELDWMVPLDMFGYYPTPGQRVVKSEGRQIIMGNSTDFFERYDSMRPNPIFWEQELDAAVKRAATGSYSSARILRTQLLGHLGEDVLEAKLRALGETDMLHRTVSFGKIFDMFFRLSPPIQRELDDVYHDLQLHAGHYVATHCRVRHPKATPRGMHLKGKGEEHQYNPDKVSE